MEEPKALKEHVILALKAPGPPPLPEMPPSGPSGRLEDQLPMEFFDDTAEGDLRPKTLPPLPPSAGALKRAPRALKQSAEGVQEGFFTCFFVSSHLS